ncbi:MAG: galactose-1-phosphate uridylyltransferase [Candidatus Eisenbacteria bacterium]|nr:galactose-1-phosphate uridylyltransferase [Candidatus Eisenbacteria bacterium]
MPELRKDPVIGRWVIISTERGKKPTDFLEPPPKKQALFCPFCSGNEAKTPPEVLAIRDGGNGPNSPGWTVRVVPNKFPALQIEGELGRKGEGLYDKMNGIGAHEVIIETPNHEQSLGELPVEHIETVLSTYRARTIDLKKDKRFRYILIFKNHGEAAGASLEHGHTQLIATPILPTRVIQELDGSRQYYNLKERCVFCDILDQEMESGRRVVCENDSFIVVAPFASRFPFETWLLPKRHDSAFQEIEAGEFKKLASVLKEILMRMEKALNLPPYNFIIHNAPLNDPLLQHYHWHMEIMPKLTKVAGFEWGTGFYINPTSPEDAAAYLREVEIEVKV